MFKIKFLDQFTNVSWKDKDKRSRYVVQYEQLPDVSKGVWNRKFHESYFSDKKKAECFCNALSEFLSDIYLTLDLVELRLRQFELSGNTELFPYSSQQKVADCRFHLLKESKKVLFCYQHIDNIKSYLNALKLHCFTICQCFKDSANSMFIYLQKLEDYFINTYRSAYQLHQKQALKFLSC
ncbi:hypothetical protein [Chryseobacterium defluvii]|uniref:Uncharacterized protein n=1 Tax=Chryseobacterium defluvii TaxID=160396 RepID=A0A495SF55_9FLAO|nr:hypothetical protein [Chryseobacterium defluvii]RKS98249.1 hypothetical protein BCF58_2390 [Chryseobacterium defluvii]